MIRTLIRIAFWFALAATLFLALAPETAMPVAYDRAASAFVAAAPTAITSDKSQHEIAFLALAVLAALGYPGIARVRIGIRLALVGALIELLQALPLFGRDCEFSDWIADVAAIVAGLLLVWLVRRRWPESMAGATISA